MCASLPLYLGGEAIGGRPDHPLLAQVSECRPSRSSSSSRCSRSQPSEPSLRSTDFTGLDLASFYAGRSFGVIVGLGAVISVAGVIVAEYIALSRLLYSVTGIPVRRLLKWIAVPFIAVDALSLLSPDEFDENVLRPSLIALFLSQLIVFAVFPLYRRRRGRLTAVDVGIAAVAFALMAWGLWRAVAAISLVNARA